MKKSSVNNWLLISVVLTLMSAVITYLNVLEKKRSQQRITHTYETILTSTEVFSLLKDLETGQRGFLLTGDSTFLDPYQQALLTIDSDINKLEDLVSDNVEEGLIMNRLIQLVESKKNYIRSSFIILQTNGADSAAAFIANRVGKITMDSLRANLLGVIRYEQQELAQQNQNLDRVYFASNVIRFTSFALIGLVSVVAFLALRKKDQLNEQLLSDLQHLNQSLEDKVTQRTLQLRTEKEYSDKLNHELKDKLDEVHQLHDRLLERNRSLLKLNEEKDRFFEVTTHDLKAPLVGIAGILRLIESDKNTSAQHLDYVKLMQTTVNSLQSMITNLLEANRIEQGLTQVQERKVDLAELTTSVVQAYQPWAHEKKIQLTTEFALTQLVVTDPEIVTRVLQNVLSNAIKFSAANTAVTVRVWEDETQWAIAIADQGPGFRKEELEQVFQKFKRLRAQPTGGESSSGLGLWIVKRLTDLLEGTIRIESEEGAGTQFQISLPKTPK